MKCHLKLHIDITLHYITSAGRDGSRDVLIMSLSTTVREKSLGNKKCDEEGEEERHIFGLFGFAVKWP